MGARQGVARNLLQQMPGLGVCHLNAANTLTILDGNGRRQQETAPEHHTVEVHLKPGRRVVLCRRHAVWIMQGRTIFGGEAAAQYCAGHLVSQGRQVRIPRQPHGKDFKDMLLGLRSWTEGAGQ